VVVGESGTLKTAAQMAAMRPLWKVHYRLKEEQKARRVITTDATIEAVIDLLSDSPIGFLYLQDELRSWFQSFNRYKAGTGKSSDLPQWLSIWSGRPIEYDRKTGDKRHVAIRNPAVSVTGGIQPGILAQSLDAGSWESGFVARLLLAYPPEKEKKWTDAEIDPAIRGQYEDLLQRLASKLEPDPEAKDPYEIELNAKARGMFIEWFNDWAKQTWQVEGPLRAAFSKIEGYAARLALVCHVSQTLHGNPESLGLKMGPDAMYAGITLARWFANEARRVYQVLGESGDTRNLRRLCEWVTHRGGRVTARDLQRASPSKYPSTDDAKNALDELEASGAGKWKERSASTNGGRPTMEFVLKDHDETFSN
jgi:hypothetical protein